MMKCHIPLFINSIVIKSSKKVWSCYLDWKSLNKNKYVEGPLLEKNYHVLNRENSGENDVLWRIEILKISYCHLWSLKIF